MGYDEHAHDPAYATFDGYSKQKGYQGLKKALGMEKQAVIDQMKAAFKDGVLEIRAPKSAAVKAKSRKIEVA